MGTRDSLQSDLVRDSKLDCLVSGNSTIHSKYVSDPTAGERRVKIEERWERISILGKGAYGSVWFERCTSGPKSGWARAVKEISIGRGGVGSGPIIDYGRELEAVAKFSQEKYRDHFVRSFGWYETQDTVFISMEYLRLGDLEKYLESPLPEAEASTITHQLLEGLVFMHDNQFAHRDLKPRNILVSAIGPQWWVKIADFGITKRIQDTVLATKTGTTPYLAPEVRGIYTLDTTTQDLNTYSLVVDVWSIGTMAFQMVTGRLPFLDLMQLFNYVVREESFLANTELPNDLVGFLGQTMAASPRNRISARDALCDQWMQPQTKGIQESTSVRLAPSRNQGQNEPFWGDEGRLSEPSGRWTTLSSRSIEPHPDMTPNPAISTAQPPGIEDSSNDKSNQTSEASPGSVWTERLVLSLKEPPPLLLQEFQTSLISGLSFSADGRWLAGTDGSKQCTVWEVGYEESYHQIIPLPSPTGNQLAVFAPNETLLYTRHSQHRGIEIWRCGRRDKLFRCSESLTPAPRGALSFSADASWLANSNPHTGAIISFWKRTASGSYDLSQVPVGGEYLPPGRTWGLLRPNEPIFISKISDCKSLCIWRKDVGGIFGISQFVPTSGRCIDYVLTSDNSHLAILHQTDDERFDRITIYRSNLIGKFSIRVFDLQHRRGELGPLALGAGGFWLAYGYSSDIGSVIQLWKRDYQDNFTPALDLDVNNRRCMALCFSPDGSQLAISFSGGPGVEQLGTTKVWRLPVI